MIRVVLAVLLSTALLAVSLPAVDTARSQRAATLAAEQATELATTADRLARRNDAVPAGVAGATRLLEVRVPAGTTLRVHDGRLSWDQDGRTHRVETAVPLGGDLVLPAGSHRVRVSLSRRDGRVVVVVRRFKPEAAATASRVRSQLHVSAVPV